MRSDAREAAFKIVFAGLFQETIEKKFCENIYRNLKLSDDERAFADALVAKVNEHKDALLSQLAAQVERFSEQRIFPVDKSIMLVALAEINYFDDIPPVVSVSEAAALARKFSTEKSADFVNGVLGGVINQ